MFITINNSDTSIFNKKVSDILIYCVEYDIKNADFKSYMLSKWCSHSLFFTE